MADGDVPGPWDSYEDTPSGQCFNRCVEAVEDLLGTYLTGGVWFRDPPTLEMGGGRIIATPCAVLAPAPDSHDPAQGPINGADFVERVVIGIYDKASISPKGGRGQASSGPERQLYKHLLRQRFAKRSRPYYDSGSGVDAFQVVDGVMLISTNVQSTDIRLLQLWSLMGLDAMFFTVEHWLRYPEQNP